MEPNPSLKHPNLLRESHAQQQLNVKIETLRFAYSKERIKTILKLEMWITGTNPSISTQIYYQS